MKLILSLIALCNLLAIQPIDGQAGVTPVRYLELVIFDDKEMCELFDSDKKQLEAEITEVLYAVNAIYREVNIYLVVKGWYQNTGFSVQENNISSLEMYEQVFDMSAKDHYLGDLKYDMLIFNSGFKFEDISTHGISQQDSVCTESTSTIFIGYANGGPGNQKIYTKEAIYWYAHEIGHQLGLEHDNLSIECRRLDKADCVMGQKLNLSADIKFSNYSRIDLINRAKIIEQTNPDCFKRPVDGSSSQISICGNGLVEKGEDCDCLSEDESCKKCCDLVDKRCQFTPGSSCTKKGCCVPGISGLLTFFLVFIIFSAVIIFAINCRLNEVQNPLVNAANNN